MSGLFGGGARASKPIRPDLTPRIQTSLEGRPIPIGAGQNRYAGNIIWYGDFVATPQNSSQSSGGKGSGVFSGKGKLVNYKYSTSFIVSLGEQIETLADGRVGVQSIANSSQIDFFYTPSPTVSALLNTKGIDITTGNTYGGTFLDGNFAQLGWSYLNARHPDQALNYRGQALACFANLALGNTATLPNFNFEVLWDINTDIAAVGPDANPADWLTAFLTNADWGALFPAVLLDGLDDYRNWCRASGLLISPVLTAQTQASSHIADVLRATSATLLWDEGVLTVLPLADQPVNGNGYLYTPDNVPLYDLTDNEFLPVEHGPTVGDGDISVKVHRQDATQVNNVLPMAYLDRGNLYNPKTIYAQDDAMILMAGRKRYADLAQFDFICNALVAPTANALMLHRSRVEAGAQYFFHLPSTFILAAVGKIVTLTNDKQNLDHVQVRITEVVRRGDRTLEITAEEFFGVPHPPLYTLQEPIGAGYNVNQDPGGVLSPIFFEPPAAEVGANGLAVWMALAGADLDIWGGANIWVATESGGTYQMIGTVNGSARLGLTTSDLPSVPAAPAGSTTIDNTPLDVDLSSSRGGLLGGSTADMLALNTACYIGGEIIAYQNATLLASYEYELMPMVRGAFGSAILNHPAGTPFVRLDDQIFHYPFTGDRIGQTIYIKFQSFNKYGGGLQDLSAVGAYPYTIVGSALTAPLPDITNLRETFKDNTTNIIWDEVVDFRTPQYEIRIGTDWDSGQVLGRVAHPPFTVFGDNNYMVKAVASITAGLTIYSPNAIEIDVLGSIIPNYVVATYDEAALGWPGTISGPGAIVGPNFVTTAPNAIAYYTAPSSHIFDSLFDQPNRLNSSWKVVGVSNSDDFLNNPDILGTPDILALGNTSFTDSWVEVACSDTGPLSNDVYSIPDAFAAPDIYNLSSGPADLTWVKYAPGELVGRYTWHRLAIISYDANTQAAAIAFQNSIDIRPRVDHTAVNFPLPAGGQTFSYIPDGGNVPVPFHGGPNGALIPLVQVGIVGRQSGDYEVISAVSLSQVVVQIKNAGVGVPRTVNIVSIGW